MFTGSGFTQLIADGGAAAGIPPGRVPFLVVRAPAVAISSTAGFPRQAYFGAGLVFSKCHADHNVPYDPYMPFLFKVREYRRLIAR